MDADEGAKRAQKFLIKRVILYNNVELSGSREFFVKGAVLDENMQKLLISDDLLFIGDKLKMAEKDLLICNSLVTAHERFIWIRIYMPDEGVKMLHAGSV